jgi:hypothetical protein
VLLRNLISHSTVTIKAKTFVKITTFIIVVLLLFNARIITDAFFYRRPVCACIRHNSEYPSAVAESMYIPHLWSLCTFVIYIFSLAVKTLTIVSLEKIVSKHSTTCENKLIII